MRVGVWHLTKETLSALTWFPHENSNCMVRCTDASGLLSSASMHVNPSQAYLLPSLPAIQPLKESGKWIFVCGHMCLCMSACLCMPVCLCISVCLCMPVCLCMSVCYSSYMWVYIYGCLPHVCTCMGRHRLIPDVFCYCSSYSFWRKTH